MDQMKSRRTVGRLVSTAAAATAAAATLLLAGPAALAQNGDRWVGTWATAVVARPQPGQGAPQTVGFGAPVTPLCFGQTPPAQTAAASVPAAASATVVPAAPPAPTAPVPAPGQAANVPGGTGG